MFDFATPLAREGTHSVKYDLRRAKFGRADVQPLWVADMDFAAPPCVQAALAARAAHPVYGYTLADDGVFEAIIDWQWRRHGWRVQREWITLLPGVVPGVALATEACTRPGETVVVQPPVYNPLFEMPLRLGRRVLENPLIWADARHAMHLDALDAQLAADPGARLLMLCSPHNPGGRVWTRAELQALGEIALRHDLCIVSDEIHADLVFPGARHTPLASLDAALAERVITLNSPGKTFNTAGLHTAYAITPNAERRARLEAGLRAQGFEGPNLFGLCALKAAYRDGEAWLQALLQTLAGNLNAACEHLTAHDPHLSSQSPGSPKIDLAPPGGGSGFASRGRTLTCRMPESTYLLWLDCRAAQARLGLDDAALHRRLIEAGLGLSPGTQFGAAGSGFMRLNVGLPRAQLLQALPRLSGALSP